SSRFVARSSQFAVRNSARTERIELRTSNFELRTSNLEPRTRELPQPDLAADRGNQLRRIVADPLPEDRLHLADVGDGGRRIAVDDHQVGLFAGGDGANPGVAPQILRAVRRANLDGFDRGEASTAG